MSFLLSEDAALKTWLSGITIPDDKLGTRAVQVWFSIPDVEVRQQSYPYVVIDLLDIRHAEERQHSGEIVDNDLAGSLPSDSTDLYRYQIPITYDLIYQVTSYSRHPRHDRAIIEAILRNKFPAKYGSLPVEADNGDLSYRSMFLDEFTKLDFVEDGRRVLKNAFTIRVISSMTPAEAQQVTDKLVQTVLINEDTTHIPSDQYPV